MRGEGCKSQKYLQALAQPVSTDVQLGETGQLGEELHVGQRTVLHVQLLQGLELFSQALGRVILRKTTISTNKQKTNQNVTSHSPPVLQPDRSRLVHWLFSSPLSSSTIRFSILPTCPSNLKRGNQFIIFTQFAHAAAVLLCSDRLL